MLNGDERGEGGGAEGSTKGKNEINDKRDAGLTNKQINTWEGPIGKWDNCATRGPSGLFLSLSPFLSLSLFLSFLCFFFALSVPVESGCIVSTSIHPTVSLSLSLSLRSSVSHELYEPRGDRERRVTDGWDPSMDRSIDPHGMLRRTPRPNPLFGSLPASLVLRTSSPSRL